MLTTLFLLQGDAALRLAAHTAYLLGPAGAEISRQGVIEKWTNPKTHIMWGGRLTQSGTLTLTLEEAESTASKYFVKVEGPKGARDYALTGLTTNKVGIPSAGWYKFTLRAEGTNGKSLGKIKSLTLTGKPAEGAQFNLKTRLNAASVHIGYPTEPSAEIEWFYNEVKAVTDPVHTFYMACGFRRGYFGMQVNGPSERRVIFSIWDSGSEAVDRNKVNDDNRVKLLAKGEGVEASDFGNEGTGGHSHLIINWRTDIRQKFLVHAKPTATTTTYTGYYFSPEKKAWTLIASFRAPKDGNWLRGIHSFNENFWGDNGYLKRAAEFGPAWIKTSKGDWQPMKTARFTHDATGGKDRFDYDLTVKNGRFLLQNGGFEGSSPKLGSLLTLPSAGDSPKIDLEMLPTK